MTPEPEKQAKTFSLLQRACSPDCYVAFSCNNKSREKEKKGGEVEEELGQSSPRLAPPPPPSSPLLCNVIADYIRAYSAVLTCHP